MNTITITGRLTRDPNHTPGDEDRKSRVFFTVASDRPGKDAGTDFIGFTAFAGLADTIGEHLEKGRQVAVTGRLVSNSYERDGETVYTLDPIAERVDFL